MIFTITAASDSDQEHVLVPNTFEDAYDLIRATALASATGRGTDAVVLVESVAAVPIHWFKLKQKARKFIVVRNRLDLETVVDIFRRGGLLSIDDFLLIDTSCNPGPNERAAVMGLPHAFDDLKDANIQDTPHFIKWRTQQRSDISADGTLKVNFEVLRYRASEQFSVFRRLVAGDFVLEEDVDLTPTTVVCDVEDLFLDPDTMNEFLSIFVFLPSNYSMLEFRDRVIRSFRRTVFFTGFVEYTLKSDSRVLTRIRMG